MTRCVFVFFKERKTGRRGVEKVKAIVFHHRNFSLLLITIFYSFSGTKLIFFFLPLIILIFVFVLFSLLIKKIYLNKWTLTRIGIIPIIWVSFLIWTFYLINKTFSLSFCNICMLFFRRIYLLNFFIILERY